MQKRMRPIIKQWPVRLYYIFPHYLINRTTFEAKLLNTKCVFSFALQLLSEPFLIIRRMGRDMIKNIYWYSCKVPAIFIRFEETLIFPTDFRKTLKYQHFIKTSPLGDELLNAFGRTDITRHKIPRPPLFLPGFHLHYSLTQHIVFGYPESRGRRFLQKARVYQTTRCHVPVRINTHIITCRFFNQTVIMLALQGAATKSLRKSATQRM